MQLVEIAHNAAVAHLKSDFDRDGDLGAGTTSNTSRGMTGASVMPIPEFNPTLGRVVNYASIDREIAEDALAPALLSDVMAMPSEHNLPTGENFIVSNTADPALTVSEVLIELAKRSVDTLQALVVVASQINCYIQNISDIAEFEAEQPDHETPAFQETLRHTRELLMQCGSRQSRLQSIYRAPEGGVVLEFGNPGDRVSLIVEDGMAVVFCSRFEDGLPYSTPDLGENFDSVLSHLKDGFEKFLSAA